MAISTVILILRNLNLVTFNMATSVLFLNVTN